MTTYSDDNNEAILNRGKELLDHMLESHNKVFVARFDAHFPQSGYEVDGKNKEISSLMKKTKEIFEKKECEVHIQWAREKNENTPHHHYHVAAFIDGSKVQNSYGFIKKAEAAWDKIVDGEGKALIHYCQQERNGVKEPGSVMIKRPSSKASGEALEAQKRDYEERRAEAEYAISYLAKNYSKEDDLPKGTRVFGSSQMVTAQKKKRPASAGEADPNPELDNSCEE